MIIKDKMMKVQYKQVINLNKVTFCFIIERKIKMWWLSDSKIMYSLVGYVSRPRMARELRQRLACGRARPAQRHLATRLRQCGNEETGGVKPWQQRHQASWWPWPCRSPAELQTKLREVWGCTITELVLTHCKSRCEIGLQTQRS